MDANASKFLETGRVFLRIGLLNFGGPAAQISLMHRILVSEKQWLTEEEYTHALNVAMLLPGPEALQVAIYAGWLRHGIRGGLISGPLFILPGFVVIMALSVLYATSQQVPIMSGLFLGIQAATIGIVIEALFKVAGRALKGTVQGLIALTAFCLLSLDLVPYGAIVAMAGFAGYFLIRSQPPTQIWQSETPSNARSPNGALSVVIYHGGIWLLIFGCIVLFAGRQSVYFELFTYFSHLAFVAFGGAYAMLSAVTLTAVTDFRWLSADAMVTGLGLAETTPGPLVLVLCFVGFQAAANQGIGAGLLGGAITGLALFLPSFLFIFLAAPHLERLRSIPALTSALSGITAAVVGVIGHLSIWFGLHFLFRSVSTITLFNYGRAAMPDISTLNPIALWLAAVCAFVLFRTRFALAGSLATGAALGALAGLLGG